MAYTNLSFDYVAIFFLIMLLIWYMLGKKVPLKSFRWFFLVIVCAFFATLLETVGYLIVRYSNVIPFHYAYYTTSIQLFFIHSFIVALTYCFMTMAHIDVRKNKVLTWIFNFSWLIIALICIPNLWHNRIMTLEDGKYAAAGIGYILYVVDGVMIALCVWMFAKRKEDFKFLKTNITVFLFLSGVACGIAQVLKFAPMLNFAIAILCVVMYIYQISPTAVTDEVTGQLNRNFFCEFLHDRFSSKKAFNVVVVNLDDFKFVNQSLSVSIGDKLLHEFGTYLDDMERHNEVFHFNADQFCIVVEGEDEAAYNIAQRIKNRMSRFWLEGEKDIIMTATTCIIRCPEDAEDSASLMEVIDYSMESAKASKKSDISYAKDMDLDKIYYIKQIEKAVKRAIKNKTVEVHYQPIYSTEKNIYNSAEALARINDPELGWISPELFIPIAEKTGLINTLGDLVFENVCRFIQEKKLSDTSIEYIDINVSPLQLMQKDYSKKILAQLSRYEVLPSQINIEITETAAMTTYAVVNANLYDLVDNGVKVSLDDYGSGYANIGYINHMPFAFIKIDKDMVWEAFKNDKAGTTLEYTICMLNALQLNIIVEGVETEEMKDRLASFGCQYLQGWYFSKAVPEDELFELIS